MKQANLAFMLALVAVVVIFKIATRKTSNPGATGGTPIDPMATPENGAITEAAYHQAPNEFSAATGADENTSGEEVTSLQ